MDTSSKNTAAINDAKNESLKSVHLVVQRYRSCRILVDESDWIAVGASPDTGSDANGDAKNAINQDHCGLVVYVSFANTADKKAVRQAALTVAQLPVMTTGQWGDGVSGTSSILQLAALANGSASLVLIPQANLISKVRLTVFAASEDDSLHFLLHIFHFYSSVQTLTWFSLGTPVLLFTLGTRTRPIYPVPRTDFKRKGRTTLSLLCRLYARFVARRTTQMLDHHRNNNMSSSRTAAEMVHRLENSARTVTEQRCD